MSQQIINVGVVPNDGTGDPLRTAFTKCNGNFTELYGLLNPAGFVLKAPSGNAALTLTTPTYTFGNGTDNPNFVFAGSGAVTLPSVTGPTTLTGNLTVTGTTASTGNQTLTGNLTITNNAGDPLDLVSTTGNVRSTLTAPAGFLSEIWLNGNGHPTGSSAVLQLNASDNLRLKNFVPTTGNLILGAGGAENFEITAAGVLQGLGPTAAAYVDMTPDSGSFTGTPTGGTGYSPATVTVTWRKMGSLVAMTIPATTGTSNATTFTITGTFPAALVPNTAKYTAIAWLANNGISTNTTTAVTVSSNLLTFALNASPTGFTNTGVKGIQAPLNFIYSLD